MQSSTLEGAASRCDWSSDETRRIWGLAAELDPTLRIPPRSVQRLVAKRILPTRFSRSRLFERMAACEGSLFSGLPIGPARQTGALKATRTSIGGLIRDGFSPSDRARVRSNGKVRLASIAEVMDRWEFADRPFGVTDLHYIGTRFDTRVDTSALNTINLLPRGVYSSQSQDSLVISVPGSVTDSHSDDHSGSNHSFVGTKLWLLWDTLEGLRSGLEDVERCDVYGHAAFDMQTFLALPSARWIFIGPGQTMFIPAHLTHKVITLERYLGLGRFHAGLPGFIDLLARWAALPPMWARRSTQDPRASVEFLVRRAVRKLSALKTAGRAEQARWGVPQMLARSRRVDAAGAASGGQNLSTFLRAARSLGGRETGSR